MPRTTSKYQKTVEESLKNVLQNITNVDVKNEHSSKIDRENKKYSPRIDLIITPEAEAPRTNIYDNCTSLKDDGKTGEFITKIYDESMNKNGREKWYEYNKNPRYFIGIEIENATVKNFKHILGSMANLSALCFMGIVVFCNASDVKVIKRLKEYMSYIDEVKKIPLMFPNVFILERSDFEEIIHL